MGYRFGMASLALVCCATIALAADPPARKAAMRDVTVERDISYVPDGDVSQRLDLYLPEKPSDKPMPLVVWIHGGGWHAGSKAGCPAAGMTTHGYAVASVEYRFSQKAIFPAQIQDCQAAIRWLRANSKKYNIDRDHIGVIGDSAGGHLVALLGTSGGKNAFPPIGGNGDQSDRVQAVCDWYGPADFCTFYEQAAADKNHGARLERTGNACSDLLGAPLSATDEKCKAASPVHYVSKDSPPTLIMHGTVDPLVPFAQSVEFADALKAAGVEVMLQPMPGSGHGGPAFSRPVVLGLIRNFFDKHLKGADVTVELLPDSAVMMPAAKPQ